VCDLLVVGGGATGLGVALQAALEGRSVLLVEASDFASGTSSRSTKLLHGGVRYLAQGRLRLVREALRERATVLNLAPHLAQPLSFVVPAAGWLRWAWTGLGLKLYQWLAGPLSLGDTVALSRQLLAQGFPGMAGQMGQAVAGMRYWDGQFEDARLALALAQTAQRAGASVHNHTRVTGLNPVDNGWQVRLLDERRGTRRTVQARCVVNAAGVWVDELRQMVQPQLPAGPPLDALVTASQGVHLVVTRACLPLREAVLIPRTADGRVLFAVPWLGATLIGTTDTPRSDAPREPQPMAEELEFLFRETHNAFGLMLLPGDVRSVWVGLRPLVGSAGQGDAAQSTSQMSREHLIRREAAGMVTVTGGKWTTYRSMAEEVLFVLQTHGDVPPPPNGPVDTRQHRLVGAPEPSGSKRHSLSEAPGWHLWGSQVEQVRAMPGAQRALGMGLTEGMVRFAARHEWAFTVEDMLARRWRALFLDARQAATMAPAVAALLQEETGLEPRLGEFLELCQRYMLGD
jgi:glycerol-3-phosphate dehydrogenase